MSSAGASSATDTPRALLAHQDRHGRPPVAGALERRQRSFDRARAVADEVRCRTDGRVAPERADPAEEVALQAVGIVGAQRHVRQAEIPTSTNQGSRRHQAQMSGRVEVNPPSSEHAKLQRVRVRNRERQHTAGFHLLARRARAPRPGSADAPARATARPREPAAARRSPPAGGRCRSRRSPRARSDSGSSARSSRSR